METQEEKMETQELRIDCGCELWTGVDHHDRPYILVEHCQKHYVQVLILGLKKLNTRQSKRADLLFMVDIG